METRSIKELLELMLQNVHLIQDFGLCAINNELHWKGETNSSEYVMVKKYIKSHHPKNVWSYSYGSPQFYWKPGDLTPRIKWLQDHIKKENDQNH